MNDGANEIGKVRHAVRFRYTTRPWVTAGRVPGERVSLT